MNHEQYNLPPREEPKPNGGDYDSSPNVLKFAKTIVVGRDKVILDANKGLFTGYVVRGINTTGYSALTVFDPSMGGFCQLRTHLDVGNATINTNSPGEKGQELYVKIDNDTDANRTITFGTPFKVTGTVVGSTAASAIVSFISDGNYFWETARTVGLNQ